ncbi:hypothetical protein BX600DRAFT_429789 [Xylariales sp. PMI_506]|nr:hypothetical protein BX600DRAFT_429789 [Xylariales sp. PMI_506]
MAGVELALAVLGTTDLCIKNAEEDIAARIVRVEAGWLKTTRQLEFMTRIEGTMDHYHRSVYEISIEILQSKLKITIRKLERQVISRHSRAFTPNLWASTRLGTMYMALCG